jgi:hypothetical protein
MSSIDRNKRADIFLFLMLLISTGFVLGEIGTIGGLLVSTIAGSMSGLMGVGIAAIIIATRETKQVRPLVWLVLMLVAVPLYFLLRTLLLQIELVTFPAYLPAEWIVTLCQVLLGLLVGTGTSLLLYGLVVEGFRLLE